MPGCSEEKGKTAKFKWHQFPSALLANAFKVYPNYREIGIKHPLKFLARGMSAPCLTMQWFAMWQMPELSPLAESHPRLLMKLQRPYLRAGLKVRERYEILRQHYAFVLETFPEDVRRTIFSTSGVLLLEVSNVEIGNFSVRLLYNNKFENEGELTLVFQDDSKRETIYALSFCVTSNQPGGRAIFIGGMQGCQTTHDREQVVSITRTMFGLRPKALLFFVLQKLAEFWNITQLRAVSNETRKLRRSRTIHSDYDQFWLDSGGFQASDRNFTLPVVFAPREVETIKPSKRTMYRRRYEMLTDFSNQIEGRVRSIGKTTRIRHGAQQMAQP